MNLTSQATRMYVMSSYNIDQHYKVFAVLEEELNYILVSHHVKSAEQLKPPEGLMCVPLRNAVAAALFTVLDVWMPSQLRYRALSEHGRVVRFTTSLPTAPVDVHPTCLLKL